MKKFILIINMLLVCWTSPVWAKVKIVSALPVYSALAQAIGGDRVSIDTLARADQDPHFLQAKPSYVVKLNRADLLLHTGMELEVGWLPLAVVQSRNPKIQRNAAGDVDLSRGIRPLEVPAAGVDRSAGDIHPLGNPHFWMDPRNGLIMAREITEGLIRVDPEGTVDYQKNFGKFTQELQARLNNWNGQIQGLKNLKVITFHVGWSYLADYAGFKVAGTVEPKPGIPPNSRHVEQLVSLVPQEGVKLLLMAPYYPRKVPEYLAEKTGVPLVVGQNQPKETTAEAYFEMFTALFHQLAVPKGA